MPQQKVVLFDIDYTLFNTDLFREKVYPALARKINYPDSQEFYALAKEIEKELKQIQGHFSPSAFLKQLATHTPILVSQETLEEIFADDTVYASSLYEKVAEVMDTLGEKGVQLGILSTGNTAFQKQKIHQIADRFAEEHLHIFTDKLQELSHVLEKYTGSSVYMVDDLPNVLATAKKCRQDAITIWINKHKKYESSDIIDGFIPDHTISDIAQVTNIVLRE